MLNITLLLKAFQPRLLHPLRGNVEYACMPQIMWFAVAILSVFAVAIFEGRKNQKGGTSCNSLIH